MQEKVQRTIVVICCVGLLLIFTERPSTTAKLLSQARPVDTTSLARNSAFDGQLLAVSGQIVADHEIEDLFLKARPHVAVRRTVETYSTGWSRKPMDGPQPLLSDTVLPELINLGPFAIESKQLGIHGWAPLDMSSGFLIKEVPTTTETSSQYLYFSPTKQGKLARPRMGDVRVSYDAIPAGQESVFLGTVQAGKLSPYTDPKTGKVVYELVLRDSLSARELLAKEYTNPYLWFGRVVAVLVVLGLGALYIRR